jgi:hypothetical protein
MRLTVQFSPASKITVTVDNITINHKLPRSIRCLVGKAWQPAAFSHRYMSGQALNLTRLTGLNSDPCHCNFRFPLASFSSNGSMTSCRFKPVCMTVTVNPRWPAAPTTVHVIQKPTSIACIAPHKNVKTCSFRSKLTSIPSARSHALTRCSRKLFSCCSPHTGVSKRILISQTFIQTPSS